MEGIETKGELKMDQRTMNVINGIVLIGVWGGASSMAAFMASRLPVFNWFSVSFMIFWILFFTQGLLLGFREAVSENGLESWKESSRRDSRFQKNLSYNRGSYAVIYDLFLFFPRVGVASLVNAIRDRD